MMTETFQHLNTNRLNAKTHSGKHLVINFSEVKDKEFLKHQRKMTHHSRRVFSKTSNRFPGGNLKAGRVLNDMYEVPNIYI